MAEYGLEIEANEAEQLVRDGANVYIFEQNASDIEFVQEILGAEAGMVHWIDMNDAHPIMMNYGSEEELLSMSEKYDGAVIVCPHGNTSRRFAEALKAFGVRAYSLKKGLTGLRSRN